MRARIRRATAVAVAVLAMVASGCSGDDDATSTPDPSGSVTTTTEPILIDRISSAGCQTDRATLQTAVEAFRAKSADGTVVPTEAELVSSQLLHFESDYYDVKDTAAGYDIVPTPGSGCD